MKILAVETSTRAGGVAILDGDTLVAEVHLTSSETHAKRLMLAIDSTLCMAGTEIGKCDGFAVTTGPGSFTGLRIGISVVKGLGFAMEKPVAGVSTLDVLAYQIPVFPDLICPVLDARKGEVYTALYKSGSDGVWQKVASDCAVDPRKWLVHIPGPCLFVGEGAMVYRELIREILGPRARFAPSYLNTLRASIVAHLGLEQIKQGLATDAASLAPHYIRKSDAEIKLGQGMVG